MTRIDKPDTSDFADYTTEELQARYDELREEQRGLLRRYMVDEGDQLVARRPAHFTDQQWHEVTEALVQVGWGPFTRTAQ